MLVGWTLARIATPDVCAVSGVLREKSWKGEQAAGGCGGGVRVTC